MEFADRTFDGDEIVLDGNSYRNCTFRNVTFVFGGGQLTMSDCNIDSFAFRFTGDLANGLFALYQLFGADGMIQILRGFVDPPKDDGGTIELKV
jgi:hypothetical protein